jgi:hypothetical protein
MPILSKLVEESGARRPIVDDIFYRRCVGKDFEDRWEKVVVGEDSNTSWFVERVLETRLAKSGIGSGESD